MADALAPIGRQARITGYLPKAELLDLQQQAAIACPSIWDDPMPKAVLEALAVGSALLTTRRGRIPEVAEGRAHIVDVPDVAGFAKAMGQLITISHREGLQKCLERLSVPPRRAWRQMPMP